MVVKCQENDVLRAVFCPHFLPPVLSPPPFKIYWPDTINFYDCQCNYGHEEEEEDLVIVLVLSPLNKYILFHFYRQVHRKRNICSSDTSSSCSSSPS